jgi:hypothetical protein
MLLEVAPHPLLLVQVIVVLAVAHPLHLGQEEEQVLLRMVGMRPFFMEVEADLERVCLTTQLAWLLVVAVLDPEVVVKHLVLTVGVE